MKKTEKKKDKLLRKVLTEFCNEAKIQFKGFGWVTHFVTLSKIPDSLMVVCIFGTNKDLAETDKAALSNLLKCQLDLAGIHIKSIDQHLKYDTEENCQIENNGRWQERFR